jgi:hypothetical protein
MAHSHFLALGYLHGVLPLCLSSGTLALPRQLWAFSLCLLIHFVE